MSAYFQVDFCHFQITALILSVLDKLKMIAGRAKSRSRLMHCSTAMRHSLKTRVENAVWRFIRADNLMLRDVTLYHLLFAAILFSPFLIYGNVLIGSTDNYFHLIPNFIFSQRAVHGGELGLWNPYLFGGINFTASTHNYVWSPLSWILLASPESWILPVFTLRAFVEVWLVGITGFLFFREEIKADRWALFSSTLYQLSGIVFFSITTYAYLTELVLLNVSCYLIWTLGRRTIARNLFFLVGCFSLILLTPNIVYGVGGLLAIGVLSVYRIVSSSPQISELSRRLLVVGASLVLALVISAVRVVPVAAELPNGDRLVTGSGYSGWLNSDSKLFLGATFFFPESLGVNFSDSQLVLEKSGEIYSGTHAQFHGGSYFGALSVLLFPLAFFALWEPGIRFWGLLGLASILWFLKVPPVSSIFWTLTYPFAHTIIPKIQIVLPLCITVGKVGWLLEKSPGMVTERALFRSLLVSIGAFATILVMWGLVDPIYHLQSSRILLVLLAATLIVAAQHFKRKPRCIESWWRYGRWVALGLVGCAFVVVFSRNLLGNGLLVSSLIYLCLSIGLILALGNISIPRGRPADLSDRSVLLSVALASGALLVLLVPTPSMTSNLPKLGFAILAILGGTRFVLVLFIGLVILLKLVRRELDPRLLFPLFLVLVVADLLPYDKEYSRQITEPFLPAAQVYPPREPVSLTSGTGVEEFDLENYRVSDPHRILGISGNEIYTNLPMVYRVRTIGGVNSLVPRTFQRFIRAIDKDTPPAAGSVLSSSRNGRLLDLMGCRYALDGAGHLQVRKTARSRFMLFDSFEVVRERDVVLDKLGDSAFLPLRMVYLEDDPGIAPAARPEIAERLHYRQRAMSVLEVAAHTEAPGILLFGDSYDEGWHATVDGVPREIIRADFNFMAVPLFAGENEVIFRFRPDSYLLGSRVSLAGLSLFGVVLLVLGLVGRRGRARAPAS